MPRNIDRILHDINTFSVTDDYMGRLEDLCAELEKHPQAKQSIAPMLGVLERYPDEDFGAPGCIVHLLETFYKKGYEEQLVASIKRRPTLHTLWMLNRIINGSKGKARADYLAALRSVAENREVGKNVRAEAKEFLENQ